MALETVSKNGIEIFSTGTFNNDRYELKDLQSMVNAFGKLGFFPPIKIGHEKGQEAPGASERLFGLPALGYVKNLYIRGSKLLADLGEIPKKFADLINAGAYRRISAEVYFDLKDEQTGKIWPRVLRAISFLGAQIPALTNLKAITELYDGNGAIVRSYQFEIRKEFSMEPSRHISMQEATFSLTECARSYALEHKVSTVEAVRQVMRDNPRTAAAAGYRQYQDGFGPIAGIVQRAKMATGATKADWIPTVIAEIKRSGRAREIAGEWLTHMATEAAKGMTGQVSANYPAALKDVMREHKAVADMYDGGAVTEAALREIFVQWFND